MEGSIEAEVALLGSTMLDPTVIDDVGDIVRVEDFSDRRHMHIWEALVAMRLSGEAVDYLTVTDTIRKRGHTIEMGYVATLSERVGTSTHAKDYARIVHESGIRSRLITGARRISEVASDLSKDVDDVLGQAQSIFIESSNDMSSDNPTDLPSIIEREWPSIEQEMDGGMAGVSTGFPNTLDTAFRGLQPGQLYLLGGRPGDGKSTLARHIAVNMALDGIATSTFSLESTQREHLKAIPFLLGRVNEQSRMGAVYTHDEVQRYQEAKRTASMLHGLYIDDAIPLSITTLTSKALKLAKSGKLGCIFVDYLQLMEGAKIKGEYEDVSPIARGLKILARLLDVPVMALSRMNRRIDARGPGAEPVLSDLYLGGESDADVVMFIRPSPDSYEGEAHSLGYHRCTLYIKKNRFGPLGAHNMRFYKAQKRFEEAG